MRLKTLLLGSATAFAFAGGAAQAADLSVAEPVDYVRVCDAFGAGYWYIPGTDTCVKIGGKVTFETYFGSEFDDDADFALDDGHTANWKFETSFDLNVTTKSMTDWGPLITFINLTTGGTSDSGDGPVEADEFYLSLGPVLLGRTGSAFDIVGGGYTWIGNDISDNDNADQIQLSWAINGFGIVLALEDPVDRWGSESSEDLPAFVAAFTWDGGGWNTGVSFIYGDLATDDFWAVEGKLEFDWGWGQLLLGGLWADDGSGNNATGSQFPTDDGWAFLASYQHNWSANLYSAAAVFYVDDNDGNNEGFAAEFTTAFSPASGLWVGGSAAYAEWSDAWQVVLFAEREFGG